MAWQSPTGAENDSGANALTRGGLRRAAEEAGFGVRSVKTVLPEIRTSHYPFFSIEYDDPHLNELRTKYHLQQVVAGAPDEWTAQQMLKDWVFKQIPGGTPTSSPRNALEILRRAAEGERFYCTFYAITYVECAHALGWQARKIGVDRKHPGGYLQGSSHHGVAEVWSNQFCKWVLIDCQSNLHFEKNGVPLNALEVRAEWLGDQGAKVDHMVGAPPHKFQQNPAMVWSVPDSDEIATYFWLYVQDTAFFSPEKSRFLLLEDGNNTGEVWFQNDKELGHSQFHNGYLNNRFEPTDRLDDLYWSVGVVDAKMVKVSPGTIHFELDTYCPNLASYEKSTDGANWQSAQGLLDWSLQEGWNTLGLRTRNEAGVTGPETVLILMLEADR
jgi:hypothetical protein